MAMSESLLDRISIDPEVVHGRPAIKGTRVRVTDVLSLLAAGADEAEILIKGTRVRVTDVLSLLAAGADEAEILKDYPYLTSQDIRACLAYAAAQADHTIVIAS